MNESGPPIGTRRGDGGIYLIIADQSEEFHVALDYACSLAKTRRGYVAVAHITDLEGFVHWGKVEAMMRHDLRQQSEEEIWAIAKSIHDDYAMMPSLYIREGQTADCIIDIINEEPNIRSLVLAASGSKAGPGPLISHFLGKGADSLNVPMVVVPEHLDKEKIQSITKYRPSEG